MTNFAKERADLLQEQVAELNEIIRTLRGALASERATNRFLQTHTEHLETMLPLCSGHAESWYCCRDHLNGGMEQQCVVCAFVQPEELSAIPEGKHGEIVHLPDGLHRDTQNLVMLFAGAMAYKLNKAQDKYGYDNGWKGSAWEQDCRDRLHEHLAKGDPRDVANYCAFMWHHGWATTAPDTVAMPKAWVEAAKCDNCGGQGWKAIQVEAGVFEQEQCQWCFEQWLALGQPTLTPSPHMSASKEKS